ncbi:unnamed protein product [Dracunculus medinensis]|uniref:Uncharacterized protein n=1 Tax=Dracunculus medinensis TaxID=318479 RepID=A0A0N4U843_DRAME|nr:unnamed protein product [Dracunculus medinensis]
MNLQLLLNGCNLVNRCELSRSQDRELQRYIDANSHLLRYGYRDGESYSKKAFAYRFYLC